AVENQPMVASILFAIDPRWQPSQGLRAKLRLRGGYFPRAKWPRVKLATADLSGCDLRRANLENALLSNAILTRTNFSHASLDAAKAEKVDACYANFTSASLRG